MSKSSEHIIVYFLLLSEASILQCWLSNVMEKVLHKKLSKNKLMEPSNII